MIDPSSPFLDRFLGRVIGHYEIIEKLGQGGMGAVYKARDQKLGRWVAIKVLLPAVAADPARMALLEQEAKAAAQVSHPHVVTVHALGTEDGNPYLVMEYVDGTLLSEEIRLRGALNLVRALDIARQIADALDAAHSRRVVHRDIKPANVIITPSGGVKVTDFGLARLVENECRSGITSGLKGTPAYMSPEQIEGRKVDHRTDIYSLGVTLYEMLTGRPPFCGTPLLETARRIVEEPWPPIRSLCPYLPASIDEIISRMASKDPDARARSAAEIRDAITRWLVSDLSFSDSTVRMPVQPDRRKRRSLRRNVLLGIAGGLVFVAAAIMGFLVVYDEGRATRIPDHAPGLAFVLPYVGPSDETGGYEVFRHLRTALEKTFEGIGGVRVLPAHVTRDEFAVLYDEVMKSGAEKFLAMEREHGALIQIVVENKYNRIGRIPGEETASMYRIMVNPNVLNHQTASLEEIPGWGEVKMRLIRHRALEGTQNDLEWIALAAAFELTRFAYERGIVELSPADAGRMWHNLLDQLVDIAAVSAHAKELVHEIENRVEASAPPQSLGIEDAAEVFDRCRLLMQAHQISFDEVNEMIARNFELRMAPFKRNL